MANIYFSIREEGEEYHISKNIDREDGEMGPSVDLGTEFTMQDVAFVVMTDDDIDIIEDSTEDLVHKISDQIKEHGEAMLVFPARSED